MPIIIFGFWYPTFVWGEGFKLIPGDFLFSFYGLMPCPTTMVLLGILTLNYPNVNKKLYFSLAIFAVIIGTAQTLLPYVPDIPLGILGYYSLIIAIIDKLKKKHEKTIAEY